MDNTQWLVEAGQGWFQARRGDEQVLVEAWGDGIVRVRATRNPKFLPQDWVLEPRGDVASTWKDSRLTAGPLAVRLDSATGHLTFEDAAGKILLEEIRSPRAYKDPGRVLESVSPGNYRAEVRFAAVKGEKFFGLGQHQNGRLDQKGLVVPLVQKNSEVSVPLLVSSRGYGVFWNNPAVGEIQLAEDRTRWIAESASQIDYFLYAGPGPAAVLRRHFEVTGFPSRMPEWATGFWQCKLRYKSRDELLAVAHEHRRRGLPMSVIVVDYFHWQKMGDWAFDPALWPDPQSMVAELKTLGIETMVSVWPSVNPDSANFAPMEANGWLVGAERGHAALFRFTDTYATPETRFFYYYDTSHPNAGAFVWNQVKTHYHDLGVRAFWLDACEPEANHIHQDNWRFHAGNGLQVANLYPLFHAQTFYRGMRTAGEALPLNLCRSTWAGGQKYGAAVWSGDIDSTFASLAKQVRAGLNMAMSGIPWWTTDIGGFYGGQNDDPEFRELVIRWFQYAVYCPLFRLHGFRNTMDAVSLKGGDNEVWSFGDQAYPILVAQLNRREALRPEVSAAMDRAAAEGVPP